MPSESSDWANGRMPERLNSPKLALYPNTPQNAAGRMTDAAVCEPSAIGTMPSATAAADPLDEPPGLCSKWCGLRVLPGSK